MKEGGDPVIESVLREGAMEPIPAPRPDLAERVVRRVHGVIVLWDLVRLATLEALWGDPESGEHDAQAAEERQDP